MTTANAAPNQKTVADAVAEYVTLKPLWSRNRAICSGEKHAKDYDNLIDVVGFKNLLIPFSPSMTQQQYNFYKAEAELPGIVAQFMRTIVGGLLRKQPVLKLPEGLDAEYAKWIANEFSQDGAPISAFLSEALTEELQTSRAWVYIDHPVLSEDASPEEIAAARPYPILWKAESVINWRVQSTGLGKGMLTRVVVSSYEEVYQTSEFHPDYVHTITVHELVDNVYRIRKFQPKVATQNVVTVVGQKQAPTTEASKPVFGEIEPPVVPKVRGEPLNFIPAWPLNGSIQPTEPIITSFVDKEIALYNKMSRRNHLLYGAATYTPVISSDMSDDDFQKVRDAGLGSWLHLRQGDTATVLDTPTAALADMDRSIAATIQEMAQLGIRMLSPEVAQSGVALDIRNASQNAQMGVLNTKVSNTLKQVIAFMLNWRYGAKLTAADVGFDLSTDFNIGAQGEAWLRLATEWYQQGLIPRSVWLQMLKQNDILPPEYDDKTGQQEITEDLDQQFATESKKFTERTLLEQQLAGASA